jgi:hypothetical protein
MPPAVPPSLSGRASCRHYGPLRGTGTAHLSNRARRGHDGRRVGPCSGRALSCRAWADPSCPCHLAMYRFTTVAARTDTVREQFIKPRRPTAPVRQRLVRRGDERVPAGSQHPPWPGGDYIPQWTGATRNLQSCSGEVLDQLLLEGLQSGGHPHRIDVRA